jgi:hypothetical protein
MGEAPARRRAGVAGKIGAMAGTSPELATHPDGA